MRQAITAATADTGRHADMPSDLSFRRALVSAFIVVQVAAIIGISMPIDTTGARLVRAAVEPYMRLIGLAQAWPMFAPDPPMMTEYVAAEITRRSDRTTQWRVPAPADYGIVAAYFMQRYWSWGESIANYNSVPLRVDAARFIARTHNDPGDPPVAITFVRTRAVIPPFRGDSTATVLQWRREPFFTYDVGPGDLP